MNSNPRNQPGPTTEERVQVWSARHPLFVFVVYPALGVIATTLLGWWALHGK